MRVIYKSEFYAGHSSHKIRAIWIHQVKNQVQTDIHHHEFSQCQTYFQIDWLCSPHWTYSRRQCHCKRNPYKNSLHSHTIDNNVVRETCTNIGFTKNHHNVHYTYDTHEWTEDENWKNLIQHVSVTYINNLDHFSHISSLTWETKHD